MRLAHRGPNDAGSGRCVRVCARIVLVCVAGARLCRGAAVVRLYLPALGVYTFNLHCKGLIGGMTSRLSVSQFSQDRSKFHPLSRAFTRLRLPVPSPRLPPPWPSSSLPAPLISSAANTHCAFGYIHISPCDSLRRLTPSVSSILCGKYSEDSHAVTAANTTHSHCAVQRILVHDAWRCHRRCYSASAAASESCATCCVQVIAVMRPCRGWSGSKQKRTRTTCAS